MFDFTENNTSPKQHNNASSSSPLESSLDDENRQSLQIKQERMELSSSHEEESSTLSTSGRPLLKRSRTEVVDADTNTMLSDFGGEYLHNIYLLFFFLPSSHE